MKKKNNYHINIQSFPPYPKKMWQELLYLMLQILEEKKDFSFKNCILNLIVVKDNDMLYYNHEQMNAYGPTNILSFPEEEMQIFYGKTKNIIKKQKINLGTLILSSQTLMRESFLYGQNPQEHVIRLLCHGLAHLLGYDHGDEMWELTDFIENEMQKQYLTYSFIPTWSL